MCCYRLKRKDENISLEADSKGLEGGKQFRSIGWSWRGESVSLIIVKEVKTGMNTTRLIEWRVESDHI